MHNALVDYAVRLVLATRAPAEHGMPDVAQLIQYGASPRASLGIVRAARALALLRGRDYALPQDVQDIAPDILRHRLVLSLRRARRRHPGRPTSSTGPAARAAADRRAAPAGRPPSAGRPRQPPARAPPTHDRPLAGPLSCGHAARTTPRAEAVLAGCSCSSPASSTACCRATTWACCPARAARRASRGSTGPATTCAGWTGRSPPAPRCRTSGRPSPTGSWRPGWRSTCRPASTSAPPATSSATWRSPPRPR